MEDDVLHHTLITTPIKDGGYIIHQDHWGEIVQLTTYSQVKTTKGEYKTVQLFGITFIVRPFMGQLDLTPLPYSKFGWKPWFSRLEYE